MMLGNLIEQQFGAGRNWPLGAAISITLMILVMLAMLVFRPWGLFGTREELDRV